MHNEMSGHPAPGGCGERPSPGEATSVRGWRRCGSDAASLATAASPHGPTRPPALSRPRRRVTSKLFLFVSGHKGCRPLKRGPIVLSFISQSRGVHKFNCLGHMNRVMY